MSSSVTQSVASSSSSFTLRPFSPTTLALQKKLANFIDAQYQVWKKLPANKIGQLATPEVLEVVKRESTAFHCNSAGEIDLMWLKKDMPLEALKYPEVAYWSNKAGPGPKHEQEEFVFVHGCDEKVMTTINSSKDHSLIAQFIYPFIDFWNLVEYHILIWIACVFCSGTLCITKPTLIVCESSKLVRIFLENYLVRVYQENLTLATFTAFLEGQFDLPFLQAMCIITIFIIIWDDLPVSPDDWYQCYGIPVVVQYGPFPEHVAILIPKQDPYRPYHMISLHEEYSELDRWARLIIELARKIVAAAPPTPATAGRKEYLVCLRQCIVEEAVRLGLWAGLEAAKRKLKRKEQCFRHYIVKTHNGKVNEKTEGASERKEKKINDGMKGVEA